MNYLILLIGLATFISTMIGGLLTIRFKNIIHYFFAFSAGSLIAVSFFDLLPESLALSEIAGIPVRYMAVATVVVFFVYSLLERFFLTHHYHDDTNSHKHKMGPAGAIGLIIHSFFDGVAIGSAFQIDYSIGVVVTFAILFHDFGDGVNTVTLMLKNQYHKEAKIFLLLDALAPVIGIAVTGLFVLSPAILAIILAAFVGEFLYIGAANLLPETYKHNSWKMALSMGIGIITIFLITSVA